MDSTELIAIVFDRENINDVGINLDRAVRVVGAFHALADHALAFREKRNNLGPEVHTVPPTLEVRIRATPVTGSIKLPLSVMLVGALSVAANASQVVGWSIRDAFAAVQSGHGTTETDDPISRQFVQDKDTHSRLRVLYNAAAETQCSYVAVEWGNEIVVLHGENSPRLAMIGSRPLRSREKLDPPQVIELGGVDSYTVYYEGKVYQAFAADQSGRPILNSSGDNHDGAGFVLLWASEESLENHGTYAVQTEEIEPSAISHNSEIPDLFLQARQAYIVTGVSPLRFR